MNRRRQALNGIVAALMLGVALAGCSDSQGQVDKPMASAANLPGAVPSFPKGDFRSPLTFSNPYAHIPAQCHIETSRGTQNACLFCHTNGVYRLGLGNNFPQAERGAAPWQPSTRIFRSPRSAHLPPRRAAIPGKIP
ncbi:MAG: hypothetical protein M0C28_24845 [Candidatus Moduliflexus flocculans]|nr:hypothetical protein [Candidatus Moduliflexus flocculans]